MKKQEKNPQKNNKQNCTPWCKNDRSAGDFQGERKKSSYQGHNEM